MKLADIVKEARGWEGEGAGFKAGIESDDKVVTLPYVGWDLSLADRL
jgi:hypothetical protein